MLPWSLAFRDGSQDTIFCTILRSISHSEGKKEKKKPLDRSLADNCSFALEFDIYMQELEFTGMSRLGLIQTLSQVSSKVQKFLGLETLDQRS